MANGAAPPAGDRAVIAEIAVNIRIVKAVS